MKNETRRIGLFAGCFDPFPHPGHLLAIRQAMEEGGCTEIVIALHADPSIERPEKSRVYLSTSERRTILESIKGVSDVHVYNTEDDLLDIIKDVCPDVRILGDDYRHNGQDSIVWCVDAMNRSRRFPLKPFTGDKLRIPVFLAKRYPGWTATAFRERIKRNEFWCSPQRQKQELADALARKPNGSFATPISPKEIKPGNAYVVSPEKAASGHHKSEADSIDAATAKLAGCFAAFDPIKPATSPADRIIDAKAAVTELAEHMAVFKQVIDHEDRVWNINGEANRQRLGLLDEFVTWAESRERKLIRTELENAELATTVDRLKDDLRTANQALAGLESELADAESTPRVSPKESPALARQVGGSHYKDMAIQPAEFANRNRLGFIEGCIVKYVCRYKTKNGKLDLEKARHFVDMLIELEYPSPEYGGGCSVDSCNACDTGGCTPEDTVTICD